MGEEKKLTNIQTTEITEYDVLFGRGNHVNRHAGNLHFRGVCRDRKPKYKESSKLQKKQISLEIVASIRDRGGRFLKMDNNSEDIWYDVGDTEAREKTSQALRDTNQGGAGGKESISSSNHNKSHRRKKTAPGRIQNEINPFTMAGIPLSSTGLMPPFGAHPPTFVPVAVPIPVPFAMHQMPLPVNGSSHLTGSNKRHPLLRDKAPKQFDHHPLRAQPPQDSSFSVIKSEVEVKEVKPVKSEVVHHNHTATPTDVYQHVQNNTNLQDDTLTQIASQVVNENKNSAPKTQHFKAPSFGQSRRKYHPLNHQGSSTSFTSESSNQIMSTGSDFASLLSDLNAAETVAGNESTSGIPAGLGAGSNSVHPLLRADKNESHPFTEEKTVNSIVCQFDINPYDFAPPSENEQVHTRMRSNSDGNQFLETEVTVSDLPQTHMRARSNSDGNMFPFIDKTYVTHTKQHRRARTTVDKAPFIFGGGNSNENGVPTLFSEPRQHRKVMTSIGIPNLPDIEESKPFNVDYSNLFNAATEKLTNPLMKHEVSTEVIRHPVAADGAPEKSSSHLRAVSPRRVRPGSHQRKRTAPGRMETDAIFGDLGDPTTDLELMLNDQSQKPLENIIEHAREDSNASSVLVGALKIDDFQFMDAEFNVKKRRSRHSRKITAPGRIQTDEIFAGLNEHDQSCFQRKPQTTVRSASPSLEHTYNISLDNNNNSQHRRGHRRRPTAPGQLEMSRINSDINYSFNHNSSARSSSPAVLSFQPNNNCEGNRPGHRRRPTAPAHLASLGLSRDNNGILFQQNERVVPSTEPETTFGASHKDLHGHRRRPSAPNELSLSGANSDEHCFMFDGTRNSARSSCPAELFPFQQNTNINSVPGHRRRPTAPAQLEPSHLSSSSDEFILDTDDINWIKETLDCGGGGVRGNNSPNFQSRMVKRGDGLNRSDTDARRAFFRQQASGDRKDDPPKSNSQHSNLAAMAVESQTSSRSLGIIAEDMTDEDVSHLCNILNV